MSKLDVLESWAFCNYVLPFSACQVWYKFLYCSRKLRRDFSDPMISAESKISSFFQNFEKGEFIETSLVIMEFIPNLTGKEEQNVAFVNL